MISKQLEWILAEKLRKTDISGRNTIEMPKRFESLRGYGLLPRGEDQNRRHLTGLEAAAGILSITTVQPGYSGLASKVLLGLCPVGGTGASFHQATNFGNALEILLTEPDALASILEVRVTSSEVGTNNNGLATVVYMADGHQKTAYYIGSTAVSVLQPGAEVIFDPRAFSSIVAETIFYRSFFKRVSSELKNKTPLLVTTFADDADEAERERQREERIRNLGIKPGARYLNVGVDNHVDWPKLETKVDFEGHTLVLMPKTREHTTSVHIDLHHERLNEEEASTLINRFLSMMAWCDDHYAIMQEGWSGNPIPVAVPRRNLAFTTTTHWIFNRSSPTSKEAKRAVSIYREGLNAEYNFMVGYAVLAYYKIIELKYGNDSAQKEWLKENYKALKEQGFNPDVVASFEAKCGNKPEDYLYRACRTAVAHANTPFSYDPDDVGEIRRLHIAADILRPLARKFIRDELGVSDVMYDGT